MNKNADVGTVRICGPLLLRGGTSKTAVRHAMQDCQTVDIVTTGFNANGWAAWTKSGLWTGYWSSRQEAYNRCRAFVSMVQS